MFTLFFYRYRVCQRWNVLTRRPALWKKVDVKIHKCRALNNTVTRRFVETLPPCATHIRLDFGCLNFCYEKLKFEDLCECLKRRCPNLEMLILNRPTLKGTYSLPMVLEMIIFSLRNLRCLVFYYSTYFGYFRNCLPESGAKIGTPASKIEVLGFPWCHFPHLNKLPFSSLPHLKKLCLYSANVGDSLFEDSSFLNQLHVLDLGGTGLSSRIFPEIWNNGLNLKELYLCGINLQDSDFNFNKPVFPHLNTICVAALRSVTHVGVVSLVQSCKSLQNAYVKEHMITFYDIHPFIVDNKCMLEIVKIIPNCEDHKRDYLCV